MFLESNIALFGTRSPRFLELFGNEPITLDDWGIGSELEVDQNGMLASLLRDDEYVYEIRTIDAPVSFSIGTPNAQGQAAFAMYIPEVIEDEAARWFYVTHEIAHLLFHRDYIYNPTSTSVLTSLNTLYPQSLECEADLFARLCFWPLEAIAREIESAGIRYDFNGLVDFLVEHAIGTIHQFKGLPHSVSGDHGAGHFRLVCRLKRHADIFLNSLRAFRPNYWQAFSSRVLSCGTGM